MTELLFIMCFDLMYKNERSVRVFELPLPELLGEASQRSVHCGPLSLINGSQEDGAQR